MSATGGAVKKTPSPASVTVGQRMLSTRGWSTDVALEHLTWHIGRSVTERECTPACLAKVMHGRTSRRNSREVRGHLWGLFRVGILRGLFVVLEYNRGPGSHGEVIALKYYERGTPREDALAQEQMRRMRKRRDFTLAQVALAESLVAPSPEP